MGKKVVAKQVKNPFKERLAEYIELIDEITGGQPKTSAIMGATDAVEALRHETKIACSPSAIEAQILAQREGNSSPVLFSDLVLPSDFISSLR